jgi:hypothetical protein
MYTPRTRDAIADGKAIWCRIANASHKGFAPITTIRAFERDGKVYIEYVDLFDMEIHSVPQTWITFLFAWEKFNLPVLTRQEIISRIKNQKPSDANVVWILGDSAPDWGPRRLIRVYGKSVSARKRYDMMRAICSVGYKLIEPLSEAICKIYEIDSEAGRDLVESLIPRVEGWNTVLALEVWHSVYESYYLPHILQRGA